MDDTSRIDIAKRYLRRKFATDVVGLARLVETIAAGAFRTVTITGHEFNGGQSSGEITFEKLAYLDAAMSVLAELDPSSEPAPPIRGALTDFSCRVIET